MLEINITFRPSRRQTLAGSLTVRMGDSRVVRILPGPGPIRTTEIHSRLSERHLHLVVGRLPGPKTGALMGRL